MTSDLLARSLQEFLACTRAGIVIEDGQVLFDLATAQYSISSEKGRCLLHFWSEERNMVRHVIEADAKNGVLSLAVRRFAQARPSKLEICRDRDCRLPATQKAARTRYARLLERVLRYTAPDMSLDKGKLSITMDLERSFSPVYARGLLRKGRSALAVLGVNDQEPQAAVDASLTFGLLWLQACREREAGHSVVEGLHLYVPPKSSGTLRLRLAHLDQNAAKFQLFELDERDESAAAIDYYDHGNISTRLMRCPDSSQLRTRFTSIVDKVLTQAPQAEIKALSSSEIAFRLHGLEFVRARMANAPGSFRVEEEIIFGPPGYETRLTQETEPAFAEFISILVAARQIEGDRRDPLWRMYPERWLESLVFKKVTAIDSRLDPAYVYSQVPAFSASDRAMIDVVTCTRDGRLAVVELKADEDIHLPLQGLDYWARVLWHHSRGELQEHGYFPNVHLSSQPPLLILVAPSLRVHPAADTLLRYFSPQIEWMLVGVDERWREEIQVIFRKSAARRASA